MRANISRSEILNGDIISGIIKLSIPLMFLNLIICISGQIMYNHYPWYRKQTKI